jgi:cytochrome c
MALGMLALAGALQHAHAGTEVDADFARSKKCLNCHAIDRKIVGPAFNSVAARYADDRDAEARLAKKIVQGGSGAWGVVPMPGNNVTAAEAQRLAHWVLMQK